MNNLMTKYVKAFTEAKGSDVQKVKHILMYHAHSWEWDAQDSLVADLIDDQNITSEDIIDFLENAYAVDGGNREFSCAIKAMKVCLQKAKISVAKPAKEEVFEDVDGADDFDNNYYVPGITDFLKHQSLSH